MKFVNYCLMGLVGLVSTSAFAQEAILCSEMAPHYWRVPNAVPRFSMQRTSILVRLNDQGSGTVTWMTDAQGKVHTSGRYNVTMATTSNEVKAPAFQKFIQDRFISTTPPRRVRVLNYSIQVDDLNHSGYPGGTINIAFENYSEANGTTGTASWINSTGNQGGNFVFCTKRTR